jgi:hypothetical protein
MATGASLYLTENYDRSTALYLPILYKTIRAYRPMPARFFSFIRPRSESSIRGEVITFDVTLLDPENRVIAEIEGFAMRRIPDDLARSLYERGGTSYTSAGGGERLIEIPDRPAIEPAEGVRALTRILQSRAPLAVVVVPQPLNLISESTPPAASGPFRQQRPLHRLKALKALKARSFSGGRIFSASSRLASMTTSSPSVATR